MLSINRTSLYYKQRPSSEWDLQLNQLIDITYTKHPEFGYCRITAWLDSYYGFHADNKTVLSRMQAMGIQAAFPDHVWSIDITYIPIQKSRLYPTAIIDWYSRYMPAWEIDDTLESNLFWTPVKRHLAALYQKS